MSSPPKRADSFSGSPGRPASPSPARSFRTRMSTAVRRASTGLSFSQVGKLSRSSSKASLKVDPTQTPATSEELHHVPSPVAESPAREAAASVEPSAPLGPSPLANVAAPDSPAPAPAPTLVADPEPALITASPEQVPIPLQPAPAPPTEPLGFSDPILPVVSEPTTAPSPVIAPPDVPDTEPEATPLPELAPHAATLLLPTEPPVPSAVEDPRPDYFSWSDPVAPTSSIAQPTEAQPEPEVVAHIPEPVVVPEPAPVQDTSHVQIPTDASPFAWSDEPAVGHKASRSSFSEPIQHYVEPTQPGKPDARPQRQCSILNGRSVCRSFRCARR
ncbi:hypothetical protein C8Q80DRAFT_557926 [Daedaleopsis nitida]|nr:hypothetical protein C8Q80DRAFT_557926 [Daedaleopsis nitida]